MEDVENQGSELKETLAQEVASPQTESDQESEQAQAQPEEKDWIKNLRKAHDDAVRREKETSRKAQMQEELLQKLMSQQLQQSIKADPEEDFLSSLQKEEYVPGEKVAKGFKKIEERFEKKLQDLEQKYQQKYAAEKFNSLRQQWPDLDDVVNPDTIRIAAQQNPSLGEAWNRMKDDYAIALVAYPYLKSQGVGSSSHEAPKTTAVDKKLSQNAKTIQSPQVFGKRPMAQAFQEPTSREEKDRLWAETTRFASQASGVPPLG